MTWEAWGVIIAAAGLVFTVLTAVTIGMWKAASLLADVKASVGAVRETTHRELNTNGGASTKDAAIAAARDAKAALEESAGARAEAAAARAAALSAHEVMSGHLDWHLRDVT